MTFPNIPNVTPSITIRRNDVINLLLASVAFEELGLAHLVNAEAEKIQAVLGTLPGVSLSVSSISQLLSVNQNVNKSLQTIIKEEMLLQFKLENILEISTSSTTTTSTTTTTSSTTTTTTTSSTTTTTTSSTTTTTTSSTTTTTTSSTTTTTTSSTTTTTTTTTSTTSTTTTTTTVSCNCSGLVITADGNPTTFENNNVNLVVPLLLSRNITGFVSIVCDCTTGSIDQVDSQFRFTVSPQAKYGFDFASNIITSTMCVNGVLTVMGSGTVSSIGGTTSPPSPAPGSYNYTLVLNEPNNTLTITLTDPTSSLVIFQTVPFAPTNGQGKKVSVTECTL